MYREHKVTFTNIYRRKEDKNLQIMPWVSSYGMFKYFALF